MSLVTGSKKIQCLIFIKTEREVIFLTLVAKGKIFEKSKVTLKGNTYNVLKKGYNISSMSRE